MIALLPNYTYDSVPVRSQPLESAPNYVSSGGATRWHRARSGSVYPDGRVAYSYWCGSIHATGPDLVAPCPHHGWNRLALDRQERVVCACTIQTGAWW